ncbi:hypothetical protein ACL1E9_10715 [Corynebacterium striatum]
MSDGLCVGFSPERYKYDAYSPCKQKEKAKAAVNATKPTRLPRFVSKAGAKLTVNEKAYDKALSLTGWKGYVTSCPKNSCPVEQSLAGLTPGK